MLDSNTFFNSDDFPHAQLFANTEFVWDALKNLKSYLREQVSPLPGHELLGNGIPLTEPLIFFDGKLNRGHDCEIRFGDAAKGQLLVSRNGEELPGASVLMAGAVFTGTRFAIGQGVLIESGAFIKEPAVFGDHTEVRQGAYLRGYCLFGKRCVVGHTTEVKHSIFLNDAKAGHFAYLGDSILGGDANLGAGTKMANLRFLAGNVKVRTPDGVMETGLKKLGAILGDRVQTGCNSVTNPGTLIGPDSILMPNTTSPSGYHPAKSIIR